MRKLIAVALLLTGIMGWVIAHPVRDLAIPGGMPPLEDLPLGFLEDLTYVLNNEESDLSLSLSHHDFFYTHDISVSITANHPGAKIYYTTDGSIPTSDSTAYIQPLEFAADEDTHSIVLKAIAIEKDEQSPVLTHSFFMGSNVEERFTTYVFSLSTDPDNLYDYEQGILIPGKTYDDFMAANPETKTNEAYRPSNFNLRGHESERPVYVETFTQDGARIVAQNAGMRVHGNVTRILPQKSLRLIARKQYEPGFGRFKYPFFENHRSVSDYSKPILSYDTLILRNGGNDYWNHAKIRMPMATLIGEEAGYTTVTPNEAAAVFVNGEYYGFAYLIVRINDHYLQDLYDAPERSFDIIDASRNRLTDADWETQDAFAQLREYAEQGFTDDTINAFHDFFDIDNFLFYFAIQVYIANSDWPHNNIEIWRYTGSLEAENLHKELDGRWRFLLFDLDHSFNRNNTSAPNQKSIRRLFEGNRSYPLFRAVVERPEYAEQFVVNVCDMMFEHYTLENVQRVIQLFNDMNLEEQEHGLPFMAEKMDMDQFLQNRERVIEFTEKRPQYIIQELQSVFGYSDFYHIESDGSCKINTLNGKTGTYFIENRVPVTPILAKGQVFDHWLINGERRDGENLLVSVEDTDHNGVVYVQCITKTALPPLFFKNTYDTGDVCGFTMYNPTDIAQNTSGFYLSDRLDNLKKWKFPDFQVPPGGEWEFVGKNAASQEALLKIGLNFNPRYGEVVFLSNEDGVILDHITMAP